MAAGIGQDAAKLERELAEALERQKATGEILAAISNSASELQPILDSIVGVASSLCGAEYALIYRLNGGQYHLAAANRASTAFVQYAAAHPLAPGRNTLVGRTALERKTVHLPDCLADPEYKAFEYQRVGQYRTMLGIPLQQGDAAIGVIALFRSAVKPFSEKQIDLVATFANQAVIAIENARLFDELQTKTRDLEQSLQQQTATADVLQVINSSPGHIEPVFAAMLEKATHLCEASFGILWLCDGEQFRAAALHGVPPAYAEITRMPIRPLPTNPLGRMLRGERLIVSADVADEDPYRAGDPVRRALVDLAGARSVMQVALAKDDTFLGSLTVYRNEVRPFSEKQIVLLQNFAAQAVIAMENVRLFEELRESLQQQTATADVLKVISRSAFDLQTVLEELTRSAASLCNADMATITRERADGQFYHVTNHNFPSDWLEYTREIPLRPSRGTVVGRTLMEKKPVQVPDVTADAEYTHGHQQKKAGYRTFLGVPLLREGKPIGVFSLCRKTVAPFSDKQIELVSGFADQAVIAIENVRLFEEVQARTEDLRESLQQQTATADVLKVISRSTFDLQTVLDTLVESVTHLCEADHAWLFQREGDLLWFKSSFGHGTATHERIRELFLRREVPLDRTSISGRSALEGRVVHVADVLQDREYGWSEAQQIGGYRAALGAPLLRDGKVVGVIFVAKVKPEPFSQKQIELVTTFADQAVIAIENARLFNETQEALRYQIGSANILKVIASSPTEVGPVLRAIVESACELCEAYDAAALLQDGEYLRFSAHHGPIPIGLEKWPINRHWTAGRAFIDGQAVHIHDLRDDAHAEYIDGREMSLRMGHRTILSVPLLREGESIGAIVLRRTEVHPFTDKQIALLKSFADQAVIAIENVRLFEEVQARTDDLRESLQQQTATADVLKVISRSTFDLETVLGTLLETVTRLCRADQAYMFRRHADGLHYLIAEHGLSAEGRAYVASHPFQPDRGTTSGRVALERRPIHIPDVLADPDYTYTEGQRAAGFRTLLGLPLLREDTLIGVFVIGRSHVEPFTTKEIELATSFADQAVIAIENARLLEELRERQAELRVTFDNMGDGVVMFGADRKLVAWNRNLQQMLDLPDAFLLGRPSFAELFHYLSARGEFGSADLEVELGRSVDDTSREMRYERTRPDGRVIEVRRNPVPDGGFVLIYADITERKRAEQAIRLARDAAEAALRELQTAQDRLIQTEKLASLGQLTAGIAHEIKNPLNFVNNFSALSAELIEELDEVLALVPLDHKSRGEVNELTNLLKSNLEKVIQHGKRADSIVKNMLQHSREGSGERRSADINALVEESLNLAYHGARAEKPGFAITLRQDFDPDAGTLELYPQDITRALLNLISNGFYAAVRRKAETDDGAFEPILSATTRNLGETIEIRIRDNGSGIPPDVREKMFNPFFTTKPTGEGTGLGLSMTHDIVVKQHGGRIDVETQPGTFTEFIVTLPRGNGDIGGLKSG